MSEHKITVPGGESVRLLTAGKYCDRDIVVTAEGGTAPEDLDAVLTEQEALIAELQDALRGKGSAWYDAFWDACQEFGKRTDYKVGFAGRGWNEKTFDPKYLIKLTDLNNAERAFAYFCCVVGGPIFDFAPYNDKLDCSEATQLTLTFSNARIRNLYVDASSATGLSQTFSMGNGGYIDDLTLRVTAICTTYNATFSYNSNLVELRFTEDSEIAGSIAFDRSTKLSKASMENIVPKLSDAATGKTVTFSKIAVTTAFGGIDTEEVLALEAMKPNWTFAYA